MEVVSDAELVAITRAYKSGLELHPDTEPNLLELLGSAVENPGGLIRAQIAYKILIQHHASPELSLKVATAIEYFHLSSLILDDLPCMDNADLRRGRLSAHREFGEATAILGSLALLNRAYALLYGAISQLPAATHGRAVRLLEQCLGASGLVGGQALDLACNSASLRSEEILKIALGKTGALFDLTFLLPAIVGGVPNQEYQRLSRFSSLVGIVYQLLDDFKDVRGGSLSGESGKSPRDEELSRANAVLFYGEQAAEAYLLRLLRVTRKVCSSLSSHDSRWVFLGSLLERFETQGEKLVHSGEDEAPDLKYSSRAYHAQYSNG